MDSGYDYGNDNDNESTALQFKPYHRNRNRYRYRNRIPQPPTTKSTIQHHLPFRHPTKNKEPRTKNSRATRGFPIFAFLAALRESIFFLFEYKAEVRVAASAVTRYPPRLVRVSVSPARSSKDPGGNPAPDRREFLQIQRGNKPHTEIAWRKDKNIRETSDVFQRRRAANQYRRKASPENSHQGLSLGFHKTVSLGGDPATLPRESGAS